MKKRVSLLVCIFALFCSVKIYAVPFDFSWSFGNIFIGTAFDNKGFSLGGEIDAFNLKFQDTESGFGFYICPANFSVSSVSSAKNMQNEADDFMVSFFNTSVFYDFFSYKRMVQLGPYLEINALSVPDITDYKTEAGMRFVFSLQDDYLASNNQEIFSIKAGARMRNNQLVGFADVGVNFGLLFMGTAKKEYERVEKDWEKK